MQENFGSRPGSWEKLKSPSKDARAISRSLLLQMEVTYMLSQLSPHEAPSQTHMAVKMLVPETEVFGGCKGCLLEAERRA